MRTRVVRSSAALLATALSLVVPLSINAATASEPKTSIAAFVALARHGLAGTYTEVYRVSGPSTGTVRVFQQAPSGEFPFPTGHGKWAFLLQAQTGLSSQWIEEGAASWDCWRTPTSTTWSCSGPGHFEEVNGFFLAVQPFIPGVVSGELNQLQLGLAEKAPQVGNLVISQSTSPRFGALRCLRVDGITSCIDRSGVLVSQRGSTYWSSITLLQRKVSVPGRAFTLVGRSTSAGTHFAVVPS